eukprot:gb/GECG01002993.1/.p1 GENE.gb/GECG01002993.1/~~gb/GECG01002993.1/.p1  ORF type:complete len:633 (+),score=65.10 gb/GECG01002993.1/:1-1899(+)
MGDKNNKGDVIDLSVDNEPDMASSASSSSNSRKRMGSQERNALHRSSMKRYKVSTPSLRTDGMTWYNNRVPVMEGEHDVARQTVRFPQVLDEQLRGNITSLEQIVSQRNIDKLLLSTFCVEQEFIAPLLRPDTGMDVTLVLHGGDEKRGKGPSTERINSNVLAVYPQLQRFGVMHAKIVVVKFNSGTLRVVISSANLTEVDWDMYMQNVWFQDFSPKGNLSNHNSSTEPTHCFQPKGPQDFGTYLRMLMNKWSVPISAANSLIGEYNLDEEANATLVASYPGTFANEGTMKEESERLLGLDEATKYFSVSQLHKFGHMRVRAVRCLQKLQITNALVDSFPDYGHHDKRNLLSAVLSCDDVGIQGSSLGSINEDFLKSLYKSFNGVAYDNSGVSASGAAPPYVSILQDIMDRAVQDASERLEKCALSKHSQSPTRVLWPTDEFVLQSYYGWRGAGMVHFQEKFWNRSKPAPFPKGCLHAFELIGHPRRQDPQGKGLSAPYVCSHTKVVYPQLPDRLAPSTRDAYLLRNWIYVGSANCSTSAWGRVSKPKSSKQVKQFLSNYELGVIISPVVCSRNPVKSSCVEPVEETAVPEFDFRFHPCSQKYATHIKPWTSEKLHELHMNEMNLLQQMQSR